MVEGGAGPKQDSSGSQLCERCEQRLNRVKGTKYKYGPGLMCHACYNKEHPRSKPDTASKRPASAAALAANLPTPKRVRRTQSDPGEPSNLTRKRTRAQPPSTVPAPKKTRVQPPPVDPSLLLDQAHAERLARLAADSEKQPQRAQPVVVAAAQKRIADPPTWRLVVCD